MMKPKSQPQSQTPLPGQETAAAAAPEADPASAGRARLAPRKATPQTGQIASGTLLALDDRELAVYRRPVTGKGLDMVYSLLGDGTALIEAVSLKDRRIESLGRLDDETWHEIQETMRWSREPLIAACADPADADRIPTPVAGSAPLKPKPAVGSGLMSNLAGAPKTRDGLISTARPRPAPGDPSAREAVARAPIETERSPGKLRRGQRITLKFGGKTWNAVYWGRDTRGSVVAHDTLRRWTLMHLDLDQYKDSLIVQSDPDEDLIQEIANQILATYNGGGA